MGLSLLPKEGWVFYVGLQVQNINFGEHGVRSCIGALPGGRVGVSDQPAPQLLRQHPLLRQGILRRGQAGRIREERVRVETRNSEELRFSQPSVQERPQRNPHHEDPVGLERGPQVLQHLQLRRDLVQ